MEKIEYRKAYKELYLPKTTPSIIDIPAISFLVIDGKGDPNGETFALETEALYSLSYAVKMSYKSQKIPLGFYDYTVFPLEGVWDLADKSKSITDKSNFSYAIMIRQPDFLTDVLFEGFLEVTKKKKPNFCLDKARFETMTDGLCCQVLHSGSYDSEPVSFDRMKQFCLDNGYERSSLTHREIYLTDPRKTEASKLKTVLRFKVNRI